MNVPKIWVKRLRPVFRLLATDAQTGRFVWGAPERLAEAVDTCLTQPGVSKAQALETLARLAIALGQSEATLAAAQLIAVLKLRAPAILQEAGEAKKSRSVDVTGHRIHAAAIDRAPGRARGNAMLHQRRWTDLERRRATRRVPARRA